MHRTCWVLSPASAESKHPLSLAVILIINWCSVAQPGPTLCDPVRHSTSGFPVLHFQTPRVCSDSCPSSQWCYLTILSYATAFSSCSQSFTSIKVFPVSWLFASGGQSIGASASASVLPMDIQGWFLLRLAGSVSLQSKGLARVFSSTTVWKHQFFGVQLSLWSNSHTQTWLLDIELPLRAGLLSLLPVEGIWPTRWRSYLGTLGPKIQICPSTHTAVLSLVWLQGHWTSSCCCPSLLPV